MEKKAAQHEKGNKNGNRKALSDQYFEHLVFFNELEKKATFKSRMLAWEKIIFGIDAVQHATTSNKGKKAGKSECKVTSFIQRNKLLAEKFGLKYIEPASEESN